MADMDINFDCASFAEIEQILELGVDLRHIAFAHTCKAPPALDMAARRGVKWAAFDNPDELHKIQKISLGMELVLRIHAQDLTVRILLSAKFGAALEMTRALLETDWRLGLVVGTGFHAGISYFSFSGIFPLS